MAGPKTILQKKRISIREYVAEDKSRIINLLNAPSIKPLIWKWQFDERHFDSSIKPVVAEDNWGNILGFNGMMPVKLHTNEHGELEAAWSCDFFVSRHCRGLGVGKEIKKELKKQSPLTFALGTSPTAAAVLKKSGWTAFKKVYSYASDSLKPTSINTDAASLIESDTLPNQTQLDGLWRTVKTEYSAAIDRSSNYLLWRYEQSPIARYRFICEENNERLTFLAVIHSSQDRISLVDYIGPKDGNQHRKILNHIASLNSHFRCMTSCPEWEKSFSAFGIRKSASPANCFIYSERAELSSYLQNDFYLMPGDCDGDILGSSVSEAKQADLPASQGYKVEQISFKEFLSLQEEWDELVHQSDNDHLFSSWLWIKTWWEHFSTINKFELRLLVCRQYGKLVGIAPLYTRRYRQFLLPVTQLQVIGCSWSGPNTFRSEYLDLIIDKAHQRTARISLMEYMFKHIRWDELIFGDIPHQSLTSRLIEECFGHYGLYNRNVHEDHSVVVDTCTDVDTYTKKLSSNFRRATIHKFSNLKKQHTVDFQIYENEKSCPLNIIETLNDLHLTRWGRPCFEGIYKEFHDSLITHFGKSNDLDIALMSIDGDVKALTYNLKFSDTIYNIQLGYDEQAFKNYSLGLVHLIQNILSRQTSGQIKQFDLLAGYGKNEYYKERFGGRIQNISTKQYLRSKWVKLIYRIYDKQRSVKNKITSS